MKNQSLVVKDEVSFNIILGTSSAEETQIAIGRDPFEFESLTNPRQWIHMDVLEDEKAMLVLGFFGGNKQKNGDYNINKVSFSVLTVDMNSKSPSTTIYHKINKSSFKYCESYKKNYMVGTNKETVTMKRIYFSLEEEDPCLKRKIVNSFDIEKDTFIVKNGELIDFHVDPYGIISENPCDESSTIVQKTINGHICQGKFYIRS